MPKSLVPAHVAIVMDGNGRWAKQRGLPRTAGHEQGEHSLFDVVEGAIEIGVKAVSAYAFSTENWSRSPDEVKFLMGFNRDVIRRRRDEMNELGVRVRWAGRAPRLWKSVIRELQVAEELTKHNTTLTLTMCVNYGGRAELTDAARAIAREVAAGRLDPDKVTEKVFARHLYVPELPDADLVWRTSGEQRLSNFVLWQAAYSEMVFTDVLWPDVDRRDLWRAIDTYARRDRRYGGAVPNSVRPPRPGSGTREHAGVSFFSRTTPGGLMSEEILATEQRRDSAREPDVLREVFEGSYRRLVVQLYAVTGDSAEAEDLVQDAFVRAAAAGRRFLKVENHEAWLRTAAINLHRNRWRKMRNFSKIRYRLERPDGPARARGARRGDHRAAGPARPPAGGARAVLPGGPAGRRGRRHARLCGRDGEVATHARPRGPRGDAGSLGGELRCLSSS